MPKRAVSFANGEIYHLVNRGNHKDTIFHTPADYIRMKGLMDYYQCRRNLAYSEYLEFLDLEWTIPPIDDAQPIVEVLSYCLLGNHFHILARQIIEGGISEYMKNVQLAYSAYVHEKLGRSGQLYQGRFEAVHVSSEVQLMKALRYVDLNPYAHEVCETFEDLLTYPWSSLQSLVNPGIQEAVNLDRAPLLQLCNNRLGIYLMMLKDRAEEQRDLARLKKEANRSLR